MVVLVEPPTMASGSSVPHAAIEATTTTAVVHPVRIVAALARDSQGEDVVLLTTWGQAHENRAGGGALCELHCRRPRFCRPLSWNSTGVRANHRFQEDWVCSSAAGQWFVAVAILVGCTVEDADDAEVREERSFESAALDDAGGDGGATDYELVEECGCDPGFGPQEGEECFPTGPNNPPPTRSRQVTLENCSEIQVPWCDAQFGCEMQETLCTCHEEFADIGVLAGWATWHCEPIEDTETSEQCRTVERFRPN